MPKEREEDQWWVLGSKGISIKVYRLQKWLAKHGFGQFRNRHLPHLGHRIFPERPWCVEDT